MSYFAHICTNFAKETHTEEEGSRGQIILRPVGHFSKREHKRAY